MTRSRSLALATASLLILAVCSRPAADDDAPLTPPVRDQWLSPSGTPLLDGFVVAEDTRLLGAPLPVRVDLSEGSGWIEWSAYIILIGDHRTALSSYLRQAHDLGFKGDRHVRCSQSHETVICGAGASLEGATKRARTTSFDIQSFRTGRGANGWPVSLGRLSVAHLDGSDLDDLPDASNRWTDGGEAPSSNDLPGPGDELGRLRFRVDGRAVGETVSLTVEEGSELVTAPAIFDGDLSPTLVAVFRLTGEPRSIVQAYRRQASRFYPDGPEEPRTWSTSSWETIHDELHCRGGCGSYEARAVTFGSASYLALTATVRT